MAPAIAVIPPLAVLWMMHTKALAVLAFGIAAASSCTLIDDDQPTTNDAATADTEENDAQADATRGE